MVTYSCPRCGFTNSHKAKMRNHFLRKRLCSPISSDIPIEECFEEVLGEKYQKVSQSQPKVSQKVSQSQNPVSQKSAKSQPKVSQKVSLSDNLVNSDEFLCRYCQKSYSHKQSRFKHEKKCKAQFILTKDKLLEKDHIIADKDKMIAVYNEQRETDRELIYELKTQVTKLIDKVGTTTHTTNNIHNNTFNIMLNAFGKEDISYIQDNFIKLLIKEGPYSSIPKLIKAIHFNPNHKENHNILIPNKKQALAKIYNGVEWEYKDKNDTIDDITDKAYSIIYNHYDGTQTKSKYMDKFIDNYEDHEKDTMKKVKGGTEIVILNNQDKTNI